MSEPIFSLEEIAEAFKYIQDNKLSTDAKAMLTMDIGYEKAEKDIIKLLEEYKDGDLLFAQNLNTPSKDVAYTMFKGDVIALIKGEK